MNSFKKWYESQKSYYKNKREDEQKYESKVNEYATEYKDNFMKNKELHEKEIKKRIKFGYTCTEPIEKQYHVMGVHYADVQRMGPEVYREEYNKREIATKRCYALERVVKDINRHKDYPVRLVYEGEIDRCNMVDNSISRL
jgi:hypothetical protein